MQVYSSDICPWWCECWFLVYWARCQTYWWSQVLLLILVNRSLFSPCSCTFLFSHTFMSCCLVTCFLLKIWFISSRWLNTILCFHRSYLCWCLIWFSLRLFGIWFALCFIIDWEDCIASIHSWFWVCCP